MAARSSLAKTPPAETQDALDYVALLGLEAPDFPHLLKAINRGFPYRAFERLLANTGLEFDELAALVDIPRRTLTRRKQAGRFQSGESDRLLRAARVFRAALTLFGDDRDAARDWLKAPQYAFGGIVPLKIAPTDVGAHQIETLVGQIRYGIFS